jgi:hypothetical protein
MSALRIVGVLLIIVGIAAFIWGGVFWTDRDTIVDAGPVDIATESREGVAIPPIVGGIALVAGIVLLVIPQRRRV